MSCGGDHTVAITESGKVYSFGQSFNGQLGLGTKTKESFTPELLTALNDHTISGVSCGESHTSLVTTTGFLLTFGDGRYGKLCLDTETLTNHYKPALSTRFHGFEVVSAHCGGCHTMVVAKPQPTNNHWENGDLDLQESFNKEARIRHRHETDKKLPPIKTPPEDEIERVEENGTFTPNHRLFLILQMIILPHQYVIKKSC